MHTMYHFAAYVSEENSLRAAFSDVDSPGTNQDSQTSTFADTMVHLNLANFNLVGWWFW